MRIARLSACDRCVALGVARPPPRARATRSTSGPTPRARSATPPSSSGSPRSSATRRPWSPPARAERARAARAARRRARRAPGAARGRRRRRRAAPPTDSRGRRARRADRRARAADRRRRGRARRLHQRPRARRSGGRRRATSPRSPSACRKLQNELRELRAAARGGGRAPRPNAAPLMPPRTRVVALAGGVGAARFLAGLVRAVPAEDVAVIVNTGDDMRFYGVHVSPDVDIVTYTLAGRVDRARGYGLEGDTTAVIDALGALGHETWFRLGDRDFAHCHHRTLRLAAGRRARRDRRRAAARARRRVADPRDVGGPLSDARRAHGRAQRALRGVPRARRRTRRRGRASTSPRRGARGPGPGVLDAIAGAEAILFCPSNPIVSIGPILAVPGDPRGAARRARAGRRDLADHRRRAREGPGRSPAARARPRGVGARRRGALRRAARRLRARHARRGAARATSRRAACARARSTR